VERFRIRSIAWPVGLAVVSFLLSLDIGIFLALPMNSAAVKKVPGAASYMKNSWRLQPLFLAGVSY
jgi:hypothetical protein